MAARRKRKPKPTVFKSITFKLSVRQRKSLRNYCKARRTTPTKLIKKMIRPYTESYAENVPEEYYVTENQLDLFQVAEDLVDCVDVQPIEKI